MAETMPVQFKREHLKLFCPQMADAKLTLEDPRTMRNIIRWSFKTNSNLFGEEATEAQNKAIHAVRLMNNVYGKQIEELKLKRQGHVDLTGIQFSIGQVIQNHIEGYRGVVYGWDRVCQHPQYITNPSVDFLQPFYSIIPDESDCIRCFGGPRMFQYVAQEDLQSMEHPSRVTNRSLTTHFVSYNPAIGRYIPTVHLQYEYPDNYQMESELEDITKANEGFNKTLMQAQSMSPSAGPPNHELKNEQIQSEEIKNADDEEESDSVSDCSSTGSGDSSVPSRFEGSDKVC